jgi:Pro-kumamolisin, activation domain
MSRRISLLPAVTIAVAFLMVWATPASGQGSGRHGLIAQRIDEDARVTLWGNTRPEVAVARDMGKVEDGLQMSHMYLQLRMSPDQEADATRLINRLHDESSAEYHQWLSLAEIESRFGPTEEDVRTVTNWLQSHGLTVNVVYRANGVIDFSGPASAVREAFGTEIHQIEMDGVRHIANIRDPQIPAALAPAIHGVTSLNDFRPHTNIVRHRKEFTAAGGGVLALVPDDLATIL